MYLKDQKANFCFLQETFSKSSNEATWRNERGGPIFFSQELNCLLTDKAEIATLIVGSDCTLEKKNKKGGVPWRPTAYRNLVKITMDSLDLVNIQRTRHPKLNAFSYVSKALGVKSRIDFFLVAKHLTNFVKKSGYPNLDSA